MSVCCYCLKGRRATENLLISWKGNQTSCWLNEIYIGHAARGRISREFVYFHNLNRRSPFSASLSWTVLLKRARFPNGAKHIETTEVQSEKKGKLTWAVVTWHSGTNPKGAFCSVLCSNEVINRGPDSLTIWTVQLFWSCSKRLCWLVSQEALKVALKNSHYT